MSKSRTYSAEEVRTAVATLRKLGRPVERSTVQDALDEHHGKRGTPRPETLEGQIAAAEADLDASVRLERLGRLSAEDRARIAAILSAVGESLSDAIADTVISGEERVAEVRDAASEQYGQLVARASDLETANQELAEKLRRSESALATCRDTLAIAQADLVEARTECKTLRETQAGLFKALGGKRGGTGGLGEQREA